MTRKSYSIYGLYLYIQTAVFVIIVIVRWIVGKY